MRHPARLVLLLLSALLAACAVAPLAQADSSIVYAKDGNVWLTSPDGAKQYQVTFDGGYESPSQADDGTIVAAKGTALIHMDRSGRTLHTVSGLGGATSSLLGDKFKAYGPWDPQVSPDAKHIAYWVSMYNPWSTSTTTYMSFTDAVVTTSIDHFDTTPQADWTTSVKEPSWVNGDRMLIAGSGVGSASFQTWMNHGGNNGVQWWFSNYQAIDNDPELSPDGKKLVAVAQTNGALSAQDTLHFYTIPGAAWTDPPYTDTWSADAVHPPAGTLRCQSVRDSEAHSPSWSPASDAIAYDDKDGIWIQQAGDLGNCPALTEKLLVGGAVHPDWGPAAVDLAQKPSAQPAPPVQATTATPASPAPVAASVPVVAVAKAKVTVAARVLRRKGVVAKVTLDAPASVTVIVCRQKAGHCFGKGARVTVKVKAGTSSIKVPVRRLARGRYVVIVQPQGGAKVVRTTRLA